MGVSRLKRDYIARHYRRHSDAKLGRALGLDKGLVRAVRERYGLVRSKAEEQWYRDHPDAELPPYTGQVPVPEEVAPFSRGDYLAASLTALAVLAVYVTTLGPTVTGEDSGELITAAYTLGVAHPPGYPLWCLLGKLFITVIPFGSIAWRVNFMSAFFGAASMFALFLLVMRLTRSRLAAIAGALAFAFSSEFWEQCGIAEVYSLNTFFIVLCLLLLVLWYETRSNGILYSFALVYGLSLCNHNTMVLLGPVFVAFVLSVDREPWRRWKHYVSCTVLALLALSLYAYLPIRSMANPPVDWGNPETWANFWDVVTRKQYTFGFTENPRTPQRFFEQSGAFLRLYSREFTPWLCWLPLLGGVALWRKSRHLLLLLLVVFAVTSFGFILLLNFNLDKESLWVNNVFWIPAYMVIAVLMGAAVAWVGSIKLRGVELSILALLLTAACVLLPLSANYHCSDKSEYYFAYDYGMNILRTLDQGAIYIPTADHATFPALYLQAVEGFRPDVSIGNKYGYPEENLYQDMPEEIRWQFRKIPTEAEEQLIEDWIIAHTDRPVYFTKKRALSQVLGKEMVPAGLVYKVVDGAEDLELPDFWEGYTWHTLDEAHTRGDYSAELILGDYHFARGREYLASGKDDEGLAELNKALDIVGETPEGLNNVGSVCAEHRLRDAAQGYYLKALALKPDYELALRNLSKIYLETEQYARALALAKKLLDKLPFDTEATWLAAQSLKNLGRVDDALQMFQRCAQLNPDDDRAYREMGFLFFNEKQDAEMARQMFARSLSLNPDQPQLSFLMAQALGPAGGSPYGPALPELPGVEMPGLDVPGLDLPSMGGMPDVPRPPSP